jgi:hypothetical protein
LSVTQLRNSSGLVQHAAHAALLLALTLLPACSGIALPQEEPPAAGVDPAYTKLVADHIRATFKNYASYEAYEISGTRWVHGLRGWNWLSCVRFQDHGRYRTYAVFSKDGAVVDSRYSVRTDECELQAYAPFDALSGGVRSMSFGASGPIY